MFFKELFGIIHYLSLLLWIYTPDLLTFNLWIYSTDLLICDI